MTQMKHTRPRRQAYTLIELLTVIGIIAILASLTAAAVMKLLSKGPEMVCRGDLNGFATSIGAYNQDFNATYIPSMFVLYSDLTQYGSGKVTTPLNLPVSLENDSKAYLYQIFGKRFGSGGGQINWSGTGASVATLLTGDQCLVFFLGGIPSGATPANGLPPGCLGFSTNPADPSAPSAAGVPRKGPYFPFITSRLMIGNNQFYSYADPFSKNTPYAYFSAYRGANGYSPYATAAYPVSDCNVPGGATFPLTPTFTRTAMPAPFYQSTNNTATPTVLPYGLYQTVYYNPTSFQIISGGANGVFGEGGLWTSASVAALLNPALPTASPPPGADDFSNFSSSRLGNPQS